jgi:hypothetical protein
MSVSAASSTARAVASTPSRAPVPAKPAAKAHQTAAAGEQQSAFVASKPQLASMRHEQTGQMVDVKL